MRNKVKQAIFSVLERKRKEGDVLPFATSKEVAHLLDMRVYDVEKIARDIEGIEKGTTNNEWYYYE